MSGKDEVDLRLGPLAQTLRRRLWLIAVVGLIGGALGYGASRLADPVYRSTTTVLIESQAGQGAADYNALLASQRLVATYARIVVSTPVLDTAAGNLDRQITVDELRRAASAGAVAETQLIDLRVELDDPDDAAEAANAIVAAFQTEVDRATTLDLSRLSEDLNRQVNDLTAAIAAARGESTNATGQRREEIDAEIDQLTLNLNTVEQRRDNLRFSSLEQTVRIRQLELAVPDPDPVSPNPPLSIAVGILLGMLATTALVLLREHLDDAIRSPEQLSDGFDLPVIGTIPQYQANRNPFVVITEPGGPASEAFRDLRLNLKYIGQTGSLRSVLITSSRPGEGKTTVCASLSVANAQSGQVTVMVDADMRMADLTQMLQIDPTMPGLANLFDESSEVSENPGQVVYTVADMEPLYVVPAGHPTPSNPSLLLESHRARTMFKQLTEAGDLLIVDSPPVLGIADAPTMAQYTDGAVIVVQYRKTSRSDVAKTVERLRQLNTKLVGFVLVDRTGKMPKDSPYARAYQRGRRRR